VANIQRFRAFHPVAAEAAAQKFGNQLWYLCEQLIGLAVFDEGLPEQERERLVHAIQNKVGHEKPTKRLLMPFDELVKATIPDLASTNTQKVFKILGIETSFFSVPVDAWTENGDYIRGKRIVDGLKVVNDHAERAVKIVQDYNRSVTTREEDFQSLLLGVSAHRRTLQDFKKRTLAKKYSL